ncbi:CYTH domain-containing protein [Mucilaginibacter sp.]|uniref:CYTH domain-containing protein n=1 Tax=Mucilaginibacter sp. TaxID=1882438 RepID=UPI000CB3101C|nr:CYTH domain-containing protein [Mucilaginibacter sp.]PLW89581.1 MAG: adenylate cyclase [Mucilaginibacter sp.]HEK19303.1 CYTH domain-containing protein [Bacteroidota bacterium]
MGIEIERKFLVDHDKWSLVNKPEGDVYRQGYIVNDKDRTVRLRVTGTAAYITLKGGTKGIRRSEYEYEIPLADGIEILKDFTTSVVEKVRYNISLNGHLWEVDVFEGDNTGLIVAEIELDSEEEVFEKPEWVTKEVSDDGRYTNAALSVNPYKNWK